MSKSKIIGYFKGDITFPIYEPPAGSITTKAFIFCHKCNKSLSGNGGPRSNVWCDACTGVDNP